MAFIQQPAYILMVLFLLVAAADRLSQRKFFRHLGPALLVIIMAAILANAGMIPTAGNASPLYLQIFTYAAPLGIFFLLLQVKLKDLRFAGLPMLLMFLLGSFATVCGCVFTYLILKPGTHGVQMPYAVAGMYASTYIGGSVNFNAVALNYGVNKDGGLFATLNAVDNIVGTIWLMLTMFLPIFFQRWFPRKKKLPEELKSADQEELRQKYFDNAGSINLLHSAVLAGLGFGSVWVSNQISEWIPQLPSILILTTIALILAQIPAIQKLKGAQLFGFLLIMLFLAVIGAYCDFSILKASGPLVWFLLLWVALMVIIHGLIIFGIGGLTGIDWDIISVASNANIGGSASAPVCANSIGRPDLQLPGLLAGSVGTSIGNYKGRLIAELLK